MSKIRKKPALGKSPRQQTRPKPAPGAAGYHELSPEERQELDKLTAERMEQLTYYSSIFQFRNAAKLLSPDARQAMQAQVAHAMNGIANDEDPATWDAERSCNAQRLLRTAGVMLIQEFDDDTAGHAINAAASVSSEPIQSRCDALRLAKWGKANREGLNLKDGGQ